MGAASSKGKIFVFEDFLVNCLVKGRFRPWRSVVTDCISDEALDARSSSAVFAFSFSFGARASRARFERAFLGFVVRIMFVMFWIVGLLVAVGGLRSVSMSVAEI
jgi:hypothetical protein